MQRSPPKICGGFGLLDERLGPKGGRGGSSEKQTILEIIIKEPKGTAEPRKSPTLTLTTDENAHRHTRNWHTDHDTHTCIHTHKRIQTHIHSHINIQSHINSLFTHTHTYTHLHSTLTVSHTLSLLHIHTNLFFLCFQKIPRR